MTESAFEQIEEKFIFEDCNYFIYDKNNHNCKETTTSLVQAVVYKPLPKNEDIANDDCKRNIYLHQHANEALSANIIRSVAINYGPNVVSACFNSIALTDEMVEALLPHLCNLRHLQFNGVNIGSVAARVIARFCANTLKTLRVSGCRLFTSESCGWLSGLIGHNSPRLHRLKALDVSSTNIDDRGMSFIAKGLGQLEYLDVGNCTPLTLIGKGVEQSLRGGSFTAMRVLNLCGCKLVGDEGVVPFVNVMPKLEHLNLGKCGNITNNSTAAIGASCTSLKTLSLEGALSVTDAGLVMVANTTKLNLLNVGGCNISPKSVVILMNKLGYVKESSSFFGFVIRSPDAKLAALESEELKTTREKQNKAVHKIHGKWIAKRHTIHLMQSAHELSEHEAALKIQAFVLNCESRKKFHELGFLRTAALSSVRIQKTVRCWLAKRRMTRLILRHTQYATIIQMRYRGKFVRSRDELVMPAILAFRARKLFEKRTNAATVIQCCSRNFLAMLRLNFLRKDFMLRLRSSILLQRIGRGMLGRRRSNRFRLFAELDECYMHKMAVKMQCFQRQWFARRRLDESLMRAAEKYLLEHNSAKLIQTFYRGSSAMQRYKRILKEATDAAIQMQSIVRGRRVPRWQVTKMDIVRRNVHNASATEHKTSLRVRQEYTHASEEVELNNTDVLDEPQKGIPGDEELLKYVFGRSFINLTCLIYWQDIGLYKSGAISKYDDRMQLWCIDYGEEDDNEWIDLVKDQDRVLVKEAGSAWIPFSYCRPIAMTQYCEKRKTIEPSNSTWTPQESREELSSEIFFCSYVSRGLLDECYQTQSYESFIKLRDSHLVKTMATSIAKVKYMYCGTNNGANEMEQFERLLRELEGYINANLRWSFGISSTYFVPGT